MKRLTLILLFFCCLKAGAQVRPIYFIGDKITTDKNQATSYAIYGKLSTEDVWMLKRYDLNNNLLQTGTYADEQLSTPHGKFVFYADLDYYNQLNKENYKLNGRKRYTSQEGHYVNGKEEGKWYTFYPDGNVSSVEEYKDGQLNGEYKSFDKFGNITVEGHFVQGEKNGEWFIESGKMVEVYEMGLFKSRNYVKKTKSSN